MGDLIPDYLYSTVYLILVFVLISLRMNSRNLLIADEDPVVSIRNTWILGIFFIIFFGTRPTSGVYMTDTAGYVGFYENILSGAYRVEYNWEHPGEILWLIIQNEMATMGSSVPMWLSVVAFLYVGANIIGTRLMFPRHTYVVFLFYVTFFLFYSGGTNGIRNADAYSLVFLAIALYQTSVKLKYIYIVILCIMGYYIHTSVIILITAFVLSIYIIKNTRTALLIWFIAIIMSLVAGNYLAGFASGWLDDDRASRYLDYGTELANTTEDVIKFRWDFLLFSALPIFIGWYTTVKLQIENRFYQILLNTYIIANSVWIVFMYAAFTNRFAMLSWCIYPYVTCYPFLKFDMFPVQQQNKYFNILFWMMFLLNVGMNFNVYMD